MALITMDEAIDWGRRGELCDLMTDADQRQVSEWLDELRCKCAENANLQQRITTQKQTIQAYRDESREWREVAERAQAENARLRSCLSDDADNARQIMAENDRLRELCGRALAVIENNCSACAYFYDCNIVNDCKCVAPKKIRAELRELGVEAPE